MQPRIAISVFKVGLVVSLLLGAACRGPQANRQLSASPKPHQSTSAFPVAVDAAKVGTYPALTKSGAGYFYDEVLEYRVWVHPGGDDTYKAFSTYEEAAEYSHKAVAAEPPLVLVLQREWVDEPSPGKFTHEHTERTTEWRVEWLAGSRRTPGSIERFLDERRGGRTRG